MELLRGPYRATFRSVRKKLGLFYAIVLLFACGEDLKIGTIDPSLEPRTAPSDAAAAAVLESGTKVSDAAATALDSTPVDASCPTIPIYGSVEPYCHDPNSNKCSGVSSAGFARYDLGCDASTCELEFSFRGDSGVVASGPCRYRGSTGGDDLFCCLPSDE